MWVYYLSDLPLDSHENSPQSLQEVLLMSNAPYSSGHIVDNEWAVSVNRFTEDTRPVQLSEQLEQV